MSAFRPKADILNKIWEFRTTHFCGINSPYEFTYAGFSAVAARLNPALL